MRAPSQQDHARPLLDLCLAQTRSDGACLYRLSKPAGNMELVLWHGLDPAAAAEFPEHRVKQTLIVPLWEDTELIGTAHFCRCRPEAYGEEHTRFLESFSPLFSSLISHAWLREQKDHLEHELGRLARKLADRGMVERAKGILQGKLECTEEEAYLRMRLASRQQRLAMGEIARMVIQQGFLPPGVEQAHAAVQ